MEIMSSPMTQYGLYGKLIEYTHRISINLDDLELTDDQYHMRIHVQDGANPITEIPSNNGFNYFKEYMSFIRTD